MYRNHVPHDRDQGSFKHDIEHSDLATLEEGVYWPVEGIKNELLLTDVTHKRRYGSVS